MSVCGLFDKYLNGPHQSMIWSQSNDGHVTCQCTYSRGFTKLKMVNYISHAYKKEHHCVKEQSKSNKLINVYTFLGL